MGFKSLGTGTVFLLLVWMELDVTEQIPAKVSMQNNVSGDKGNQSWSFSGEGVFVRSDNDDIVTTVTLIIVKGSMLFLTKY